MSIKSRWMTSLVFLVSVVLLLIACADSVGDTARAEPRGGDPLVWREAPKRPDGARCWMLLNDSKYSTGVYSLPYGVSCVKRY